MGNPDEDVWLIPVRGLFATTGPPIPLGQGPGDVVPGAYAWWGLRAYSLAAAGSRAINLRRDSDNATQDFNTLSSGALDVASITTFKGAANLFVTVLYDQTGTGLHLSNPTAATQPAFILAGLGSLPIITFTAASSQRVFIGSASFTETQPGTAIVVANHTAGRGVQDGIADLGGNQMLFYPSAGNQAGVFAGSNLTRAATDGSWHAVQDIINGASSSINVDAGQTTGNAGTQAQTGSVTLGADSFSNFFDGSLVEAGYWQLGFTGPQLTGMNTNIHNYWGFV
jgi:hypothetical protein